MFDPAGMIGLTLDSKYRLEQKLGQGGMGAVFRATHLGTDRVVALKLIAPGLMDQEKFVQRFQREARAAGCLRHPNIVDLTDFGIAEWEGGKLAYLVMEFLEGETLSALLKRSPRPPQAFVVEVVQQVCSALQEAHDKGIVHRDLKPDNLWLEPNRRGGQTVKILDFGLAKIYDPKARADGKPGLPVEEDPATQALDPSPMTTEALMPAFPSSRPPTSEALHTEVGTLLGTPAYMSPEQCRGVQLDNRSDLYSLGVIIYQMLSGHTPFQGGSLELLNQHIQSEVPNLREARPDLPAGMAELVMECMAKDPRKRPESAEILGNALEAYAQTSLRRFQQVFSVLVERSADIWPLVRWHTLGAMVLMLACSAVAYFAEPGRSSIQKIICFGPAYLAAGIWYLYVFGTLKGLLAPLVLVHVLFPLQPVDEHWLRGFMDQVQAMRRLVRQNLVALILVCLPGVLTLAFAVLAAALGSGYMQRVLEYRWWIVGAGVVATYAPVVYLSHKVRRSGGSVAGASPCALLTEGLSLREAATRMPEIRKKALAHHLPKDTLVESFLSLSVLVALTLYLLAGFVLLAGDVPEAISLHTVSHSALSFALAIPVIMLLCVIDAIATNLAYFRLRKIARESLRDAFAKLKVRFDQGL